MKVLVEAERLRRAGVDVVDFGAGEPDFPTPGAREGARAHAAIDADFTKYTPNAGIRELQAGHLRALPGATTASTTTTPRRS